MTEFFTLRLIHTDTLAILQLQFRFSKLGPDFYCGFPSIMSLLWLTATPCIQLSLSSLAGSIFPCVFHSDVNSKMFVDLFSLLSFVLIVRKGKQLSSTLHVKTETESLSDFFFFLYRYQEFDYDILCCVFVHLFVFLIFYV